MLYLYFTTPSDGRLAAVVDDAEYPSTVVSLLGSTQISLTLPAEVLDTKLISFVVLDGDGNVVSSTDSLTASEWSSRFRVS